MIGENLRTARKAANISLEVLASRIGVSAPQLSRIERGERNAKAEDVEAIARVLSVPVSELYGTDVGPASAVRKNGVAADQAELALVPVKGDPNRVHLTVRKVVPRTIATKVVAILAESESEG